MVRLFPVLARCINLVQLVVLLQFVRLAVMAVHISSPAGSGDKLPEYRVKNANFQLKYWCSGLFLLVNGKVGTVFALIQIPREKAAA